METYALLVDNHFYNFSNFTPKSADYAHSSKHVLTMLVPSLVGLPHKDDAKNAINLEPV